METLDKAFSKAVRNVSDAFFKHSGSMVKTAADHIAEQRDFVEHLEPLPQFNIFTLIGLTAICLFRLVLSAGPWLQERAQDAGPNRPQPQRVRVVALRTAL